MAVQRFSAYRRGTSQVFHNEMRPAAGFLAAHRVESALHSTVNSVRTRGMSCPTTLPARSGHAFASSAFGCSEIERFASGELIPVEVIVGHELRNKLPKFSSVVSPGSKSA